MISEFIDGYWPHSAATLSILISITATIHASLTKRDVRSAAGWVGVIWLSPFLGALAYYLLGINRIRRRAVRLRARGSRSPTQDIPESSLAVRGAVTAMSPHLSQLRRLVNRVTHQPLTQGNRIEPLMGGDAAYPAMLEAIAAAERTIALGSYIFDLDRIGRQFVDALADARRRGVEVRVLLDAVGSHYSRPPVTHELRARDVTVGLFMQTRVPWRLAYANMRTHRKMLIVDGQVGFAGGMNIREAFASVDGNTHTQHDIHFKIEGPVVAHIGEVFAQDWAFTTGEVLDDDDWFPELHDFDDGVLARGVASGPDRPIEGTHMVLMGALAVAQRRVRILSPYFLPDQQLIGALAVAAQRGVEVDIIVPEKNNLRLVQWASTAQLRHVIRPGCSVWLQPEPFNHSKLMVIDDLWSYFGSSNWDPRSLRLNFEFDIEVYDPGVAGHLDAHIDAILSRSKRLSLDAVNSRGFVKKVRDSTVWLASPYL
ncbi:MAG: cardiolipin synthase [Pseudomonadota bacterium]